MQKINSKQNGGFWEELGRVTALTTVTSLDTGTFAAKKYLVILVTWLPSGGNIGASMRFNSDSGSNYNYRYSINNTAENGSLSQPQLASGAANNGGIGQSTHNITNIAAREKTIYSQQVTSSTAGAGNYFDRYELAGKWANTSAQITSVQIIALTNSFAAGTEIVVLGHD